MGIYLIKNSDINLPSVNSKVPNMADIEAEAAAALIA